MGFEMSFMHTSVGAIRTPEFCCVWSADSRPAFLPHECGCLRLFPGLSLTGAVQLLELKCPREILLRAARPMLSGSLVSGAQASGIRRRFPACRLESQPGA